IIANPFGADLAHTNLAGVLYMALGSLSVGSSFVYARKFLAHHQIQPVALATYQLGLALISLSLFTDMSVPSAIWSDGKTLLGLSVGLGLLGTGCAYIFYYYIVAKLGAVTASSATYIPPVVALAIGAFLGEPLGWASFVATGLIFLGVFLLKSSPAPADKNKGEAR
ncbi:MAG: DMT family transporter, partial [Cellvibrionaceae bacterium]|nr:DMT family transporter [Cellvibrionaceae bacterium]